MAKLVRCADAGRGSSYHHRVVTTFVVLGAINLFFIALCVSIVSFSVFG